MTRSKKAALWVIFFVVCSGCSKGGTDGSTVVEYRDADARFFEPVGTNRVDHVDLDKPYDAVSSAGGLDTRRNGHPDIGNTTTSPNVADAGVVEPDAERVDHDTPNSGEFAILTYNVAGLPQFLSGSNPSLNIPIISPLLNGYELVLVQEDFWYHSQLAAQALHLFRSDPSVASPMPWSMGDGLNRFSQFYFENLERVAWGACNGIIDSDKDCLTTKGFSAAITALQPGASLCVYNFHMDAGGNDGDVNARSQQAAQLAADMATRCAGLAIIAAGDTNMRVHRRTDMSILKTLLAASGLTDSCRILSCDDHRVDRILFRSSPTLLITPLEWHIPDEFVNAAGDGLSDHEPVAVRFRWAVRE